MNLTQAMAAVRPLCEQSMEGARRRFTNIAIPLGSLGLLEDAVVQLAGIRRKVKPAISRRAVIVFCADNGVVAQGVTQCGQEITAIVTENMNAGKSTVCLMAKHIGMKVIPVDIGVARDVNGEHIIRRKIAYGTHDITQGPAMTRDQAIAAVEVGIEMAEQRAKDGCELLCVGEMGIGNTTTSAAVTAVLTGAPAADVTGRGAGLSSQGLQRKIRAVETALSKNRPDPADPIDIIAKVGGLDIAGMVGVYLGGAAVGLPIIIDGVIASAAALLAARLCPACRAYMIASHRSEEPAGMLLLEALQAAPFITAGMRLGEGTGAAAAVALLDLVLAAYLGMPSFDDAGIEAYQPLT